MNFNEMKKQIKGLSTDEAKTLLLDSFLQIQLLNKSNMTEEEFIETMKNTYNFTMPRKALPDELIHCVHIIFGEVAADSLKFMLRTTNKAKHEKVITFPDSYSIGPIEHLHTKSGIDNRIQWLNIHLNQDIDVLKDQYFETIEQIKQVPPDIPIYIWSANHAHDQTGLLYAVYLLRHTKNNIIIIDADKTYRTLYDMKDTQYKYVSTAMMSADRLYRIYELNKRIAPLTADMCEHYHQQWLALSENSHVLRIWQDEQIIPVNENHLDTIIIESAKTFERNQFIKSARLIAKVISSIEQHITDEFIEYRIRQLITNNILEVRGYLPFYDVRSP